MEAVTTKYQKILLIDDDPVDNMISHRYLMDSNLAEEYITIDSSLDAYDYLFNEIDIVKDFPDVILLDLNMPVYNGFEFLDKIENLFNLHKVKSKVYILTSSNNPSDLQKTKNYKSVAGYFIKPFSEVQLKEIS